MWKTQMITKKQQIKYCFRIPSSYRLSDSECEKRIRYINYKLNQTEFNTTNWKWIDLYNYIIEETPFESGFDEGDYIAMNQVWDENVTYNNLVASSI